MAAHSKYRELHRKYPEREFLFVSTEKALLDVTVHRWVGAQMKASENNLAEFFQASPLNGMILDCDRDKNDARKVEL
ncbi:MAG: hypothetical protein HRT35_25585 [Algicola sp.]|nr:hypothetical protein [Algicola sp.]